MSYLYIPTSTLNFNNIFSTESISPARFYGERGFGYSQFEPVTPQQCLDAILLYDKYPIFNIDDDGRDHYPMVIKVDESLIKEKNLSEHSNHNDVTVFSLNETIYFRPDRVEVFFRNERELNIALIKAEPSLTTKMVSWYKDNLFVFEDSEHSTFKWESGLQQKAKEVNKNIMADSIKSDRRIDRLKGLAYGYVLGKCRSIPNSEAKLKNIFRELTNQKAGLINSSFGIHDAFKKIINEEFNDFVSRCSNRCKEVHVATQVSRDFSVNDDMNLQGLLSADEPWPVNESFIKLVNGFCLNHDFTASLFDDRLDVARKGGEEIRAIIGSDKWEGSRHKKYINELLNNVKSGKPFDFNSLNSPVLQCFAAFILKGDDLEKLESYLLDKGIGGFSLSFALWGGMFGFSKIPKTLFEVLSEYNDQDDQPLLNISSRNDDSYAWSVYNHIYNELHGRENIDVTIPVPEEVPPVHIDPEFAKLSKELKEEFSSISAWLPVIHRLYVKYGIHNMANKFYKLQVGKDLGGKITGVSKTKVTDFLKKYSSYDQDSEPNLPFNQPSPYQISELTFLDDPDVWNVISDITPLDMHSDIQKDLNWFQGEFMDPNSKFYAYNPEGKSKASRVPYSARTNKLAIDSFVQTEKNRKVLTEEHAALVKKHLLERYGD